MEPGKPQEAGIEPGKPRDASPGGPGKPKSSPGGPGKPQEARIAPRSPRGGQNRARDVPEVTANLTRLKCARRYPGRVEWPPGRVGKLPWQETWLVLNAPDTTLAE